MLRIHNERSKYRGQLKEPATYEYAHAKVSQSAVLVVVCGSSMYPT